MGDDAPTIISKRTAGKHHFQRRSNSWFWRRAMGYIMMAFCMTTITWLMWYGDQSGDLHNLIAKGCFYLLGGIFLVYVAGATADDLVTFVKGVRSGFSQPQDDRPRDRDEEHPC